MKPNFHEGVDLQTEVTRVHACKSGRCDIRSNCVVGQFVSFLLSVGLYALCHIINTQTETNMECAFCSCTLVDQVATCCSAPVEVTGDN